MECRSASARTARAVLREEPKLARPGGVRELDHICIVEYSILWHIIPIYSRLYYIMVGACFSII